jgi:hypothetical protein
MLSGRAVQVQQISYVSIMVCGLMLTVSHTDLTKGEPCLVQRTEIAGRKRG